MLDANLPEMPSQSNAVLDSAHVGDIRGALGTIALGDDHPRLTLSAKLFQQSYMIDKRITPRLMAYEKTDLWIGIVFVVIGAIAMMAFCAATFGGHPEAGNFTDAGGVAAGLDKHGGKLPATLFAIALIDASIIGASGVSLATAYALGDVLSLKHSLHRKATDAKGFYLVYSGLIAAAATLVLIPGAPLGLITEGVQTLAGVLLPSATVFLLLLCNDCAVLGPWVNRRWTNLFTGTVIALLVLLSIVLTASVLYPDITGQTILLILGVGAVVALVAAGATLAFGSRGPAAPVLDPALRPGWRIPALSSLGPNRISSATRVWMVVLRGYLLVAPGMVLFRIVQLALAWPARSASGKYIPCGEDRQLMDDLEQSVPSAHFMEKGIRSGRPIACEAAGQGRGRRVMRVTGTFKALLLSGLLAGCAAPSPPPQPAPLVAVPGPAKTEAQFREDDNACRAEAAQAPANAPAQPTAAQAAAAQAALDQGQTPADPALVATTAMPPGVVYLRCMTTRQNAVAPLVPTPPVLYSYYTPYPIYAGLGFGFPFFYESFIGFGFNHGGYGRFHGGHGYGGYRNYGFREGGFHHGRFGGGGFGGHGGFGGGGHGGFGGGGRH